MSILAVFFFIIFFKPAKPRWSWFCSPWETVYLCISSFTLIVCKLRKVLFLLRMNAMSEKVVQLKRKKQYALTRTKQNNHNKWMKK